MHRHRHRQTTADQDGRIERAQPQIRFQTRRSESVRVPLAVNEVRHEHPAEEHKFREQEDPHSDGGSVLLLRVALEMVPHFPIARMCMRASVARLMKGDRRFISQRV